MSIANPGISEAINIKATRERWRQRTEVALGAAAAALTLAYFANPLASSVEATSGAAIVVNADAAQVCATDVNKTTNSNDQISRYDASVDGFVMATKDNPNIPFTFILDGTSDKSVNLPAGSSSNDWTAAINKAYNFLNAHADLDGEYLPNAEQAALAAESGKGGNIFLITSGFDGIPGPSQDANTESSDLKSNSVAANQSVSAIVIGRQVDSLECYGSDITSSYSPESFQALGISTTLADSPQQIEQAIDAKLHKTKIIVHNQKEGWPLKGMIASGAGLVGLTLYRRASGIKIAFHNRFRRTRKGDE